jgi:cytochrome c
MFKKFIAAFAVIAALLPGVALAQAKNGTKAEAQAMAKKAAAYIKSVGTEKAFAEINTQGGQFHDRDLYVFVGNLKGVWQAHGQNAKLIGRDLSELKDADGKPFIKEILKVAESGKGAWVDYKWTNPVTKAVEAKTSWIERVPGTDLFAAVGAYQQ